MNRHSNRNEVAELGRGEMRNPHAAMTCRTERNRIAAVNGDAAEKIIRVKKRAERRVARGFYLARDLKNAGRRDGDLPFAFIKPQSKTRKPL